RGLVRTVGLLQRHQQLVFAVQSERVVAALADDGVPVPFEQALEAGAVIEAHRSSSLCQCYSAPTRETRDPSSGNRVRGEATGRRLRPGRMEARTGRYDVGPPRRGGRGPAVPPRRTDYARCPARP